MDLSSDLVLWSALVGMALPPLVALIQTSHWDSKVNAAIFAACCFVAAGVTELVRNGTDFDTTGYFETFVVVVTAAIALFKLYWRPSALVDAARAAGPIR